MEVSKWGLSTWMMAAIPLIFFNFMTFFFHSQNISDADDPDGSFSFLISPCVDINCGEKKTRVSECVCACVCVCVCVCMCVCVRA